MMGRAAILAVALAAATSTVATSTTTEPVELVTPTTSTRPTRPTTPPTRPPMLVTPTTSATTTTTTTTTVATSLPAAMPTAPPGVATLPPVIAAATTTTMPDGAIVAIGAIDTDGAVPDGLDLTAFPGAPQGPGGPAAGDDDPQFAAGFSCAYQCIKSGVAYPRGTGAELVVETHVPARLFMSVVDHDNDLVDVANSVGLVTEFSWALDHLEPGATYFVIVAATDENDDTAHAFGQFTTLSRGTVEISVGYPTVFGGPTNIVDSITYLGVSSLDYVGLDPDETSVHIGLDRYVDVAVLLFRKWETSQNTFCEGIFPDDLGPQGDSDARCGCWNTAAVDGLDLDAIPDGPSRWTEVTWSTTLQTPFGDDGLPPSYGDPRYFTFSVPVTFSVAYD